MGKLIFLILICILVYFLIVPKFRKKEPKIDEFVECQKCKTFINKQEAIIKDEKFYCKDCK